jgi:phage-related minor tail protein
MLQEKIQGREREYQIQREIDRLITEGVEPQKAKDLINTKYELLAIDRERIHQQELLNSLVNTAGQQFSNLFQNLITGTNNWNDALRNALNTLANALLNYGISALGGSDGRGFFSVLAGTFGGARAQGGSVGSGRSYLVGEQGPELFMPKASGTIVPNHALGGGTANIVVNVDASGSSAEGDSNQQKQLGEAIGIAIRQELIKQQRPGGLLA